MSDQLALPPPLLPQRLMAELFQTTPRLRLFLLTSFTHDRLTFP